MLTPLIVEFSIVTFLVCRRLIPNEDRPLFTTRTWLIVTLEAVISRLCGMYSPVSTAPFPSTSTQPRESQCQPGPLETWPGTVFRAIPDGTPVFVASGNPHSCGTASHLPATG